MSWLTLNGWAQPADSLSVLFPNAQPENYTAYKNLDEWLAALAEKKLQLDVLIGWSLGGHLAVEAVRRNALQTKALVLMAAPIQFVRDEALHAAMPAPTFAQFKKNYDEDSLRTAKRFAALMAMGDAHAEKIHAQMPTPHSMADTVRWQHWLHFFEHASHLHNELAHLPPTLLIHGAQDAIVPAAQVQNWQQKIPHAQTLILPNAGHAPHWHDETQVSAAIHDFVKEHAHA